MIATFLRPPRAFADWAVDGVHRDEILRSEDRRQTVVPPSEELAALVVDDAHAALGEDAEQRLRPLADAPVEAPPLDPRQRSAGSDGQQGDPAPEVLVYDLAPSTVNLRIRWWTDSRRSNTIRVRGAVLEAVKNALDREGVELPYPTRVVMLHDLAQGNGADPGGEVPDKAMRQE